jgi:hypothetical protein
MLDADPVRCGPAPTLLSFVRIQPSSATQNNPINSREGAKGYIIYQPTRKRALVMSIPLPKFLKDFYALFPLYTYPESLSVHSPSLSEGDEDTVSHSIRTPRSASSHQRVLNPACSPQTSSASNGRHISLSGAYQEVYVSGGISARTARLEVLYQTSIFPPPKVVVVVRDSAENFWRLKEYHPG